MSGHSIALPRANPPPQTLLERARADLRRCDAELRNWQNWRDETEAMVDLLRQAIAAVDNSQFDDELYHTYKNIHTGLQGWYGKTVLKGIFRTTWNLLSQGRLTRQTSEQARLAQRKQALEQEIGELKRERATQGLENQELKAALTRSVAAEEKLAQSIAQFEKTIAAKDAIIAIHTGQIVQLKKENADLKAQNAALRQQLAGKPPAQNSEAVSSASIPIPRASKPSHECKDFPPSGERRFGGGSPISQPSPRAQSFSSKQSLSEDDYPSERLRGGRAESSTSSYPS